MEENSSLAGVRDDVNTVFLNEMAFMLPVGKDAWNRENKAQPVNVSLHIDHVNSVNDAAASDDVSKSLDYGKLYKSVQHSLEQQNHYANVQEVAEQMLLSIEAPGVTASVEIGLPKAALRAEGGLIYFLQQNKGLESHTHYDTLQIRGIKCACIIGVNPHERRNKQMVVVQLTFRGEVKASSDQAVASSAMRASVIAINQFHQITTAVAERVEGSSYHTVEALASAICKDLTVKYGIAEIEVSVEKPYAIPSIGAAGVRISRRRSFFENRDFWQAQKIE